MSNMPLFRKLRYNKKSKSQKILAYFYLSITALTGNISYLSIEVISILRTVLELSYSSPIKNLSLADFLPFNSKSPFSLTHFIFIYSYTCVRLIEFDFSLTDTYDSWIRCDRTKSINGFVP